MACNGDCGSCNLFSSMREELIPADLTSQPTTLVLNVTDQCTHRCKYCFVNFNESKMSFETAEQCVKFVMKNSKKYYEKTGIKIQPTIIFFGGEPLLRFDDIIKPLIERYQDCINWSITTNAFLLDEEIANFLYKYEVHILFSIDGDKETQDLNRVLKTGESTFEVTKKHLLYWKMKTGELIVRPTLTKNNMNNVYRNYCFFRDLGATSLFFGINQSEDWTNEDEKVLISQFSEIAKDMIKNLLSCNFPFIKVNNLIASFMRISDYMLYGENKVINLERCGLGFTGCAVTTDGKLIGCQERNSYHSEEEIIGDVWNGIDFDKRKSLVEIFYNRMKTIECYKECPSAIAGECTQTFCLQQLREYDFKIPSGHCVYHRALMTVASKLFDIFSNHPNRYIREIYFQEVNL